MIAYSDSDFNSRNLSRNILLCSKPLKNMFQESALSTKSKLSSYLREVSSFCPFLMPSQNIKALLFSSYSINGHSIETLQEKIFYYGLLHAELLRASRRSTSMESYLLSENLIFDIDVDFDYSGQDLFSWPHWCLKVMYTKVGVMFGKFWVGEKDFSKDGIAIPEPPENMLLIRSAILKKDMRFFKRAHNLLTDFELSYDDGSNILSTLGVGQEETFFQPHHLENKLSKKCRVQNLYDRLIISDLYKQVLEYGKSKAAEVISRDAQ